MSESLIKQLLAQGENEAVEFKRSDVRPESLASEIVAFANTNGGHILLGVDDSGQVLGCDHDEKTEEWISNITRNNVIPAIDCKTIKLTHDDKLITHIKVPKGKDRPYQTLKHQFLLRIGSTNRIATQQELLRLFQQSGAFHFDAVAVEGTSMKSLDMGAIDDYFNHYDLDFENDDDRERILKNADILTEQGQATHGGLLVFGLNPQKYLPMASISFAHFKGKEMDADLIDQQVLEGSLPHQVARAFAVIKNNITAPSTISGMNTVAERPEYSDKVFRELIVNALVHRNYSIAGSRIRILMFEDRLEVISPGNLPYSVTIEKLPIGVSYAPNPILLKFMENLRYVDKLGRGLPMVYSETKKLGRTVLFEEIGVEFKVTLPLK